jgi:hypothetical protein
MKIIKKQTFRSSSNVNITDDMVRVTVDMTMREWYLFCDIFNKTKNMENKN